ncbi:cytochrome P450 [Nocardia miyunensis]|uniref:cytochrome P450 n=1 Tax=Nocardia miyunensis TaxID=282684 RepID=UPI000A8C13DF|nr:cytochrome P450 [Nocardia miyunensis]
MEINLLDPALFSGGQPYDVYRWLREHDPVHWHDDPKYGPGFWALTRHADIRAVESDSETFSSEPNTVLATDTVMGDETHRHLIFSDPPHHTAHRKFLSPELGLPRVRRSHEQMTQLIDDIIDAVIERGECDLVSDISGRLASFVIADLLGLDREEALELFWAVEILTRANSRTEGPGARALQVFAEHSAQAWKKFSAADGDDTLTRIAHGEIGGVPVDEQQFAMDFHLLVNAGSDTSRNAVSTGVIALLQHPRQHRMLLDDPGLVPGAVEEILRWDPPIIYQRRTATRDTTIAGTPIAEGDKVVSFYGAGNRDPEVFEQPETFDITRNTNPHLTFGTGRHFCLGAHLARQELVLMFTALLARMPDLRLAGQPSWHELDELPAVNGPARVPVEFTPGARTQQLQGEQANAIDG